MKILERKKNSFVRVIIGVAETGQSGLKKPIRTLNIEGSSPEQVYEFIFDSIKNLEKVKK